MLLSTRNHVWNQVPSMGYSSMLHHEVRWTLTKFHSTADRNDINEYIQARHYNGTKSLTLKTSPNTLNKTQKCWRFWGYQVLLSEYPSRNWLTFFSIPRNPARLWLPRTTVWPEWLNSLKSSEILRYVCHEFQWRLLWSWWATSVSVTLYWCLVKKYLLRNFHAR